MGKFVDLTGQRFGRLVAIRTDGKIQRGNYKWLCKCDCGKVCITRSYLLLSGKTKSCGCLQKEMIGSLKRTHGLSRERIHAEWDSMKRRCYNEKQKSYINYGARGIKLCKKWKNNFMSFYNWAINNGYNDSLTIDRIDNDGDYCPENCRWVSMYEQRRNKSTNVHYLVNDVKLCLVDTLKLTGVKACTYYSRKHKGLNEIKDLFKGADFTKYKIERI